MLVSIRISNTQKKHEAVYNHFIELFDKKRIRIDDAIKQTADKFFYSVRTVEDIIREQQKK